MQNADLHDANAMQNVTPSHDASHVTLEASHTASHVTPQSVTCDVTMGDIGGDLDQDLDFRNNPPYPPIDLPMADFREPADRSLHAPDFSGTYQLISVSLLTPLQLTGKVVVVDG